MVAKIYNSFKRNWPLGPIWGYISLDNDMNTVYGAVFDHKAETPGLGRN